MCASLMRHQQCIHIAHNLAVFDTLVWYYSHLGHLGPIFVLPENVAIIQPLRCVASMYAMATLLYENATINHVSRGDIVVNSCTYRNNITSGFLN
jgi:hypothetical protein